MKNIFLLLFIVTIASCSNSGDKQTATTPENKNNTSNSGNENSNTTGDINDGRISNAGAAKRPKGKMSYVVDGNLITIDENTVQCMYIGMNSSMAQSVISGGNNVTIIHMGIPKVGHVEIKNIATMPSVGIQIIIDGVQYNNKKAGDASLAITKVTQDGKNYYVAGTFSGKFTSLDGAKSITVTDGVFESAYL